MQFQYRISDSPFQVLKCIEGIFKSETNLELSTHVPHINLHNEVSKELQLHM